MSPSIIISIITSSITIVGSFITFFRWLSKSKTKKAYRNYCDYLVNKFSNTVFERVSLPIFDNKISKIDIEDIFIDIDLKELSSFETKESIYDAFKKSVEGKSDCKNYKEILANLKNKENKFLALIGDPGSGKSTLFKYICYSIAKGKNKQLNLEDDILPMYIECGFLSQNLGKTFNLIDYIPNYSNDEVLMKQLSHLIIKKAKKRKIMLLFDGLDEVADSNLRELTIKYITSLSNDSAYCKNYFLISSRTSVFSSSKFSKFDTYVVMNFNLKKIKAFSNKFFDLITDVTSDSFIELLTSNITLKKLACNPLFLSILISLYVCNQNLSPYKTIIFDAYVNSLIGSFEVKFNNIAKLSNREYLFLDKKLIYKIITEVAFKTFLEGLDFTIEIVIQCVISAYGDYKNVSISEYDANYISTSLIQNFGLIINDANNRAKYRFLHNYFLEFLSSCYVFNNLDNYDKNQYLKQFISEKYKEQRWDNVVKMLAEKLYLNNDKDLVYHLLEILLEIKPTEREQGVNYLIIGEILSDMSEYVRLDENVVSKILNKLDLMFTDEACPIDKKVRAGFILSIFCDFRFKENEIVPEMVSICSGRYNKGTPKEEIGVYINEVDKVPLTSDKEIIRTYWKKTIQTEQFVSINIENNFKISKYPITNQQYYAFVCDENYKMPFLNDDDLNLEYSWNQSKRIYSLKRGNCPVVLVDYYDAENYCKWLSKKTGRIFRLPTEDEWEYVAKGNNNYRYPWGNKWLDNVSNTIEFSSNLESFEIESGIIPVGCFVHGQSSFGVFDLAGQIWEWTSTDVKEEEDFSDYISSNLNDSSKIVKGGAWDDAFVFARCAARGPNKKNYKSYYIGFRIVEEIKK